MRKTCILIVCCVLVCPVLLKASKLDSTNIPLFVIDTRGATIVDEPKVDANLRIIYRGDGLYNKPTDIGNIYEGRIGIELRGYFSQSLPQKPYGIETKTGEGENYNVKLFNMPSEHDWILLANYNDKSFMRNTLAFRLFEEMGHYGSRTQFCEVIVNEQYQGIYIFCEKLKRDKSRIDISKLDTDDNTGDMLTGGYIFKVDYPDNEKTFKSNYYSIAHPDKKATFIIDYPKSEDMTTDQYNYLKGYVASFEDALFGADFKDPQIGYRAYIDVQSFIDYFILSELSRNVDAYKKSCRYFKDRNSKGGLLNAGPAWDFDWAWKNFSDCSNTYSNTKGKGWAYQIVTECNPWPTPPDWIVRLMEDEAFVHQLHTRYFTLRETILSEEYLFSYIDSVAILLKDAQKRHYTKWPILGKVVGTPEVDKQPTTYAGEVSKFKNWIETRFARLDSNMPGQFTNVTESTLNEKKVVTKAFPNPASNFVYIDALQLMDKIVISNLQGKTVQAINCNGKYTEYVDIESFEEGIYLAYVNFSDGSKSTVRFIKK